MWASPAVSVTAARVAAVLPSAWVSAVTRALIGETFYPQTTAEAAKLVVPTNYFRRPGDLRRYGWLGDGTDDTTAWQQALDTNSRVLVPAPTSYSKVTAELAVASGTVIRGLGNRPLVRFVGSMAAANLFALAASASGVRIENLELQGDQSADASDTHNGCAIYGPSASKTTLANLLIHGFPQAGASFTNATVITVDDDCEIYDIRPATTGASGVAALNFEDACDSIDVGACYIHDIGLATGSSGHGIRLIQEFAGFNAPQRVHLMGTRIEEIQQHGIVYYDHLDGNVTDGIDSILMGIRVRRTGLYAGQDLGNGIYIQSISNVSLIGCRVDYPNVNTTHVSLSNAGISVTPSGTGLFVDNIVVSGCVVRNAAYDGVVLSNIRGGLVDVLVDTWGNRALELAGPTSADGSQSVHVRLVWRGTTDQIVFQGNLSTGGVSSDCEVELASGPARTGYNVPFVRNYSTGIRVRCKGTAAPTQGTWAANDRIEHAAPAVGDPQEWVCTVAGTPGTFTENGQVGSVEETAANLGSAAAAINTTGKFLGKLVWDSTNNRFVRSEGPGAVAAWDVVDGSVQIVPA